METEGTETLDQEQQRRIRVNRMKKTIIWTIAIWMLVSFLAIIGLLIAVVRLNLRVKKLECGNTTTVITTADTQKSQAGNTNRSLEFKDCGIDQPDNLAEEGDSHTVYLTFNCRPGDNTSQILDILKEENVKATFFVVGDDSDTAKALYQRIIDEGHTLGMCLDPDGEFETNLLALDHLLYDCTGVHPKYFRFTAGTFSGEDSDKMKEDIAILEANGLTYFDWNISGGDTVTGVSADDIVSQISAGVPYYKNSVVLLHDQKGTTVTKDALGPLIEALEQDSVSFAPIDDETYKVQYLK